MGFEELLKLVLDDMAEGWMPEVVCKTGSFNRIFVQVACRLDLVSISSTEIGCQPPSNLGDLQGMCQSIMENVALGSVNNLSNAGESSELGGV